MGEQLKELLLELYLNPEAPPKGVDPMTLDFAEFEPQEPIFSAYCVKAMELVRAGLVDENDVRSAFDACAGLQPANLEYVVDLLRRVSTQLSDRTLEQEITRRHLQMLVDSAQASLAQGPENDHAIRRARRIGTRALRVLDETASDIDPNLRADIHLAYGSSFARPVETDLKVAVRHYAIAFALKREGGAADEAAQLQALIGQMADHTVNKAVGAQLVGGAGEATADLKASYEAARVVGDPELIVRTGLGLASAYRAVRQSVLAEPLLRSLLEEFTLEPDRKKDALIDLAGALSEQYRFLEALEILEPMHAASEIARRDGLFILGNSRCRVGELAGAQEIFESILADLEPVEDGQVPIAEIQVKMLLGDLACRQGDPERGIALIREAQELAKGSPPILDNDLNRGQIAAGRFLDAGLFDEARECLDHALQVRRWHLENQATPQIVESILGGFRELDFMDVELALTAEASPVQAFTRAEAAKGRLLTWSLHRFDPETIKAARILDAREDQLERVQRWLEEQPKETRILSLFATTRGFATFSMTRSQEIEARWVTPFSYPTTAKEVFEPWEAFVSNAYVASEDTWQIANHSTSHLLQLAGDLLWRAFRDLTDGGERLLVIPHRMFRSIPLAAAVLPGGQCLGELYDEIAFMPTLGLLSDAIERQAGDPAARHDLHALVDPDGSLPFSRLEALVLGDDYRTVMGGEFTRQALRDAFFESDSSVIHLSCHGDFDETNAWGSSLFAVDGALQLSDLLLERSPKADLVVLGACEAGKSQRSPSDEPIGFAELLIQAGVGTVVSPVWKVDDFATLLFIVEFHRRRTSGVAAAVASTSAWLRTLPAIDARTWLRGLRSEFDERIRTLESHDREVIESRLDRIDDWLHRLPPDDLPFSQPLDCAGFQVMGLFREPE